MAKARMQQDKYSPKDGKRNRRKNSGKGLTKGSIENSRDKDLPDDKGGTSDNDVSWYAENEYLLRDAGSMPFSNPAGVTLDWDAPTAPDKTQQCYLSVPAVMTIDVVPAVGDAQSATDPINIAARNIFGFIRANQTVSAAYNQVAVMMMLLSMTSCFAFYSFCTRAYGLIRTYAQRNRAIPEALFYSMGLDYKDFVENISDFRFWLNTFAEKVGALCIPASMSYIMRQVWLFQNVFLDGPTDKSQMYIYNPAGLLKYNPTGHGTGSETTPCLDCVPVVDRTALKTVKQLIALGDALISPLFLNNIINTISGDILKSYGEDKVWRLLPIHEEYEVVPILNSEVLDQIHNLFVPNKLHLPGNDYIWEEVDSAKAVSYIKVKYESDTISSSATTATKLERYHGYRGLIIDFDRMDISPADVMIATRLMVMPDGFGTVPAQGAAQGFSRLICGSEIVYNISTIRRNRSGSDWVEDKIPSVSNGVYPTLRPFYKHPIHYTFDSNFDLHLAADVENYTPIMPDVLRKLHETALLSEFHVPLMGRLIK